MADKVELDAYHKVLRAFCARSDFIAWSQEALISELRKELKVTDEQHREVLRNLLYHDETLRTIRQSRLTGKDPASSPISPSPSRKKQKANDVAAIPSPPPPVPVSKSAVQEPPSPSGRSGLMKQRTNTVADVIVPRRGVSVRTPGPASGSGRNHERAPTPGGGVRAEDETGRQTHMIEYPGADSIAALKKRVDEIDLHSIDVREMKSVRQLAKDYEAELLRALETLSDYDDGADVVNSLGLDDEDPHQNAQDNVLSQ